MAIVESAPVEMEKTGSAWLEEGLPEEVRLELKKGNFVRAAHLANQMSVSHEKVRELQSEAIRHFIETFHNFDGAKKLMLSYGLDDEAVRAIIKKVFENPKSHTESMTWFNRRKARMVASTLAERIQADETFGRYR